MLMEVKMSMTPMEEARLKELLKIAVNEVFEERKDLIRDLLEEALEDMALSRAIDEGARSEAASRDDVFNALEGRQ
ncbi:MAG: hypothetical protein LC754_01155 [Acidobacteria bacterium]|nr:hypothetical protein [Acidobacteriota bacterium]